MRCSPPENGDSDDCDSDDDDSDDDDSDDDDDDRWQYWGLSLSSSWCQRRKDSQKMKSRRCLRPKETSSL